jgi:IS605 OrfB family transposase
MRAVPATRTRLTARYRSQCLKQALDIVTATRKIQILQSLESHLDINTMPLFEGSPILDSKFIKVNLDTGLSSFDLAIQLSTLKRGKPICLVAKKTRVLNRWLHGAEGTGTPRVVQGCALKENKIILWVEMDKPKNKIEGEILGLDLGVNKLISDSLGNFYGTEFKQIRDKINRRKKDSHNQKQARIERDHYINRVVKSLPWLTTQCFGVEELKNLKLGKKPNRSKNFRKALAPWTYRQVLTRIGVEGQRHGVPLIAVPPQYTSQTCPKCRWVAKGNRRGENFQCERCGYAADADTVGALNILRITKSILGNLEFPTMTKDISI